MARATKKPRFSVRLRPRHFLEVSGCSPVQALREIDDYVVRCDCRGESLRSAASDVLDGWATKDELRPFFRQKLLTIIPTGERIGTDLCGDAWTVALTPRAIRIFWPDREAA